MADTTGATRSLTLEEKIENLYSYIDDLSINITETTTERMSRLKDIAASSEEKLKTVMSEVSDSLKSIYGEDHNLFKSNDTKDIISDIETVTAKIEELKKAGDNEGAENLYKSLERVIRAYKICTSQQEKYNKLIEEGGYLFDNHYMNSAQKLEEQTKKHEKGFTEIKNGFKGICNAVSSLVEPWRKAEHAAMGYAKSVGMSEETTKKYLNKSINFASNRDIGLNYNKTIDEFIVMQQKYSEAIGRNVQLTDDQKEDMLAIEKIIGEDGMTSLSNNLENFGLGMSDTANFVSKTFSEATKYGISASKLTKTVTDNIKMAQNYTFKNGIDGLTSMAKKAIQLKTDLSLVNGLIEKTSTVEGAINTGAQLQVLGGNYAMGSDPLSMMYDSLNDAEAMFDRAVGMAKGKVFYNESTGNFEMGAMDRYMAKQAATVMGVDPEKLIDVAFRQASLGRIESQARQNSVISNDPDMMELIKNVATWDKGNAVVNIDGKDKKISEIDEGDKEALMEMQKTDSENLRDIAKSLRSSYDIIEGYVKEKKNEQADWTENLGNFLKSFLKMTGLLNFIANIDGTAIATVAAIYKMGKGVMGVLKGIAHSVNMISRNSLSNRNLGGTMSSYDIGGEGSYVGGDDWGDYGRRGRRRGGFGRNKGFGGRMRQLGRVTRRGGLRGATRFLKTATKGGFKRLGTTAATNLGLNTAANVATNTVANTAVNGAGSTIANAATNTVANTAANTAANTTSNIAGNVASNAGKSVLKGAGKAVLKGVGKAALRGVGMGVGSLAVDMITGDFKENKAKSIGSAVGATVLGAVGSIFGPVGTFVGGWLGGKIGGWFGNKIGARKAKQAKEAKENIIKDFTASNPRLVGVFSGENAIQGNYSKDELNSLKSAIEDGSLKEGDISPKLAKKMKDNGDLRRIFDQGISVYLPMANGGFLKGASHAQGGMPVLGSNIEVEGGEYIINKASTKKYRPLLEYINNDKNNTLSSPSYSKPKTFAKGGELNDIDLTKKYDEILNTKNSKINISNVLPNEPLGKQMTVINNYYNSKNEDGASKELKIEPITLNINGNIKLDTGSGNQLDISQEILKNPAFITRITELISKELNKLSNGSFNKEKYVQKFA